MILSRKNIKIWLSVNDMGGPVPDIAHDYDYNVGIDCFVRGA